MGCSWSEPLRTSAKVKESWGRLATFLEEAVPPLRETEELKTAQQEFAEKREAIETALQAALRSALGVAEAAGVDKAEIARCKERLEDLSKQAASQSTRRAHCAQPQGEGEGGLLDHREEQLQPRQQQLVQQPLPPLRLQGPLSH